MTVVETLNPVDAALTEEEQQALIAAITRRRIVISGVGALLASRASASAQTPLASPVAGVFPRTIIDARGEGR